MKDNKLIAEFMGWKRGTNEETNTNQFFLAQPDHWYLKDENELEFHTSWDWLMPVVEKIEKLEVGDVKWTSVYFNIEREYDKAVKFIKKYNDGSTRTS